MTIRQTATELSPVVMQSALPRSPETRPRSRRAVVARRKVKAVDGFLRSQEARALSAATVKRRRAALNSLSRFVAPAPLLAATPVDIEEWVLTLRAPRTKAHYRSDANVFFVWAKRRGLVDANPVEMTDPTRVPRSLPNPLTSRQILTGLAIADVETRRMILLGAMAGLRISEIVAVHTDDLSLHRATAVLVVRSGKGGKDRVVPVHPELRAALAGVEAGWVFPSPKSAGHLSAHAARERMVRTFARAGIWMHPHQLRASFATACAEMAEGNLLVVAELMGHESMDTTRGYIGWHPSTAAQRVVAGLYSGLPTLDNPTGEGMMTP